MTTPFDDTLDAMKKRLAVHKERLANNPDYQMAEMLEKMIEELSGEEVAKAADTRLQSLATNGKLSQLGAVTRALKTRGYPMTTTELLPAIEALGARVGGEDKKANLGSVISASKQFRSVPLENGTKGWWFKDDRYPGEG
jgi:hypothetical protein